MMVEESNLNSMVAKHPHCTVLSRCSLELNHYFLFHRSCIVLLKLSVNEPLKIHRERSYLHSLN